MQINNYFIAPNTRLSDLPKDITIDVKIEIFQKRLNGWKLEIADKLINGVKDINGKIIIPPTPDAGYATLDIILSYFEMIAKYYDGYLGEGLSKYYFKKGVRMVFPETKNKDQQLVEELLVVLYHGARCGTYHMGLADSRS